MVEIEDKDGNTRFASLKKGQLIESITLEEAIELFALPRNLGEYNGEELWVGIGRYGAYIRQGKTFASLGKSDDPYTVTRERAIELLEESKASAKAASEPVKTFAEDKELVIKNGRYGAYIAYKGKNYRIPSSKKPEMLSYDECVAIVNSPKNAKKK
jgi:DNA topoisomerase-1